MTPMVFYHDILQHCRHVCGIRLGVVGGIEGLYSNMVVR